MMNNSNEEKKSYMCVGGREGGDGVGVQGRGVRGMLE